MPIREYLCGSCGHIFEEVSFSKDKSEYRYAQCRCGETAENVPSAFGGVNGVKLSDARPKNSTSYKSTKPFTGNK